MYGTHSIGINKILQLLTEKNMHHSTNTYIFELTRAIQRYYPTICVLNQLHSIIQLLVQRFC